MKSHYANIKSALGTQNIVFDCSCTDSGTYAYVYPTQPNQDLPVRRLLVGAECGHRLARRHHRARDQPLRRRRGQHRRPRYWTDRGQEPRQESPSKAIRNADSHEVFCREQSGAELSRHAAVIYR